MNITLQKLAVIGTALLIAQTATAAKVRLPAGMGGVPDIGAIPCEVITGKTDPDTGGIEANSGMVHVAPMGTRLSILTWTNGYLFARTGKSLDQLVTDAEANGQAWDFDRLTNHLVEYCSANPAAITREAARDLETKLLSQ